MSNSKIGDVPSSGSDGATKRRRRREKLPISERATLTVEETALYLGIGRQTAYDEARCGMLPIIRAGRHGKRILVVKALLDEMIQARARDGWRHQVEDQSSPDAQQANEKRRLIC